MLRTLVEAAKLLRTQGELQFHQVGNQAGREAGRQAGR